MNSIFQNVQAKHPLIHHITNYVTVNDCANIQIACGGSPIMADCIDEMSDMANICQGLVLNIGTLNRIQIESMFEAGRAYNSANKPIILDPVGCGATKLRTETTFRIIEELSPTAIRGNLSEIKTIYDNSGQTKGVDASEEDKIVEETIKETVNIAEKTANKINTTIIITGAIDIVTNGKETYIIKNGHESMANVSGTGCMLTSIICAYISANSDTTTEAAAAATGLMGLAGENAYKYIQANSLGYGSLKTAIIDAVSKMNTEKLAKGLKIEKL